MQIQKTLKLILMAVLLLSGNLSFATEDEDLIIQFPQDQSYRTPLKPSDVYSRTQSVLDYYNSPQLTSGQQELNVQNGTQSYKNIQNLLKYFDVSNMFPQLFTLSETQLQGFDDLNGKTKLNFKINLSKNSHTRNNLQDIPSQPLRGLKIAIDPGHMGESFWDDLTGKYIKDSKGNYLSEGVMALQTSLLLQSELKSLGAEVQLTRMGMTSVTDMNIKDLPVSKFAKMELLEHVYSSWFLKLLESGVGSALYKAFDRSPDRKKLWAESARYNYFILKEDLWARANKINNFKPDIVLIIHYDILASGGDGHGINKNSPNHTKIYISGAFFDNEFGSKRSRRQFASKILNQTQWEESINLSRNILDQFKSQMDLTFPQTAQGSIPVEAGIFARNLTLPRFLNAPAISYLECLFYNRPQEFYALSNTKYPMIINGVNYPYSDRLLQVVSSIKQGVINYTTHLQ